jgi:hypothetical protein
MADRWFAAPKKKEQQKMALGDFLADQCMPRPLALEGADD